MKHFKEKSKILKKTKSKLVKDTFELDKKVLNILNKMVIENKSDLNTIINIILQDKIIELEKKKIKFDGLIMDNFEYIDYLESKNTINETILIIDWNNFKNKAIFLPII